MALDKYQLTRIYEGIVTDGLRPNDVETQTKHIYGINKMHRTHKTVGLFLLHAIK